MTDTADTLTRERAEVLTRERAEFLERKRIAKMKEAAKLSSMSQASLRRYHADKIIHLGPRRDGMRVEDALMLGRQKQKLL
jgi:hypothetical protein